MTAIATIPASLDEVLDHAAFLLDQGQYRSAPLVQQVQFALGDAFRNSGHTGEALQDLKLIVSDVLWIEAGERNLNTYLATTHDRRKVVRLIRRAARKNRS
jgi:hypothetical protein